MRSFPISFFGVFCGLLIIIEASYRGDCMFSEQFVRHNQQIMNQVYIDKQIQAMKRGKRQIIQKTNIFANDEQPRSFSIPTSSSNQAPWQSTHQNQPQSQPQPQQQSIYHDNSRPEHHNQQEQNSVDVSRTESTVTAGVTAGDDDRKKRLEMLKQKYLKNGTAKEESKAHQPKVQHKELVGSKKQERNGNQNGNFFDRMAGNSSENTLPVRQDAHHNTKTIKNENQTPFSKPTQNVQHQRVVPPVVPQAPNRKKVPPPPPKQPVVRQVERNIEWEQNRQPLQSQHSNQAPYFAKYERQHQNQYQAQPQPQPQREKPKPEPKTKAKRDPRPPKTQKPIPTEQPAQRDRPQVSSFHQILNNWLSNTPVQQKQSYGGHQLQQIVEQIAPNNDKFQEIALAFVVNNKNVYTSEQVNAISHILQQLRPNVTKLLLSIKCGGDVLAQNGRKILNSNVNTILSLLITLKSHLLQSELNNFITFYLSNATFTQQTLILLVRLAPSNQQLYDYIGKINFESPTTIAQLLLEMKKNISEPMSQTYFKLINSILGEIQDPAMLESLLAIVNSVAFQSVYQAKKDIKLKIIQKIDRLSNPNQGNFTQARNFKEPAKDIQSYDTGLKTEKQSDQNQNKGLKNLMGYVNQAIKKIASTIPEKPAQSPAVEEPKQSIQWDPVTRRYLINGKVPEDQYGNTNVNQESPDKPKKKAPPPPPRIGNKASQNNKEVSKQAELQVTNQKVQSNFNPFATTPQGEQQEQEKSSAPPPQRVGLKGIASKKPKLQARYT